MIVPIQVKIEYINVIHKLGKRTISSIIKNTNQKVASVWRSDMLRQHFTHRGRHKYGYQQRRPGYLARKKGAFAQGKAIAPNMALVFSGRLKNAILGNRAFIRASTKEATVTFIGPSYWKRYRDGRPDIVEEVLTVTRGEMDRLDKEANDFIDHMFKTKTTRKTRRII